MVYSHMLLFAMWMASEWDIALTVGLFVIGVFISLISWLSRKRMEAYDKHLEECRERAVVVGRMDERLHSVEYNVTGLRTSMHWVGNCIVIVGAKLDVKLPDRPN